MRYQMVDASVVVVQLTGDVLVIDKQGVTHPVKIGEHLPAGSMLILEGGAHVQLEPGDSSSVAQPSAMPEMPEIVPAEARNAQTGPVGVSPLGAQGTNDIAAIQQAILQGIDPTLNFEATAAGGAPGAGGGGAGGSGNAGFVSVDRTGASILAAAGFDTSYSSSGVIAPTEPVAVAENNPPLAVNDAAVTDEDQPVTIKVLANDSDPDGDAIAVIGAPLAEHGVVTVNPDGSLTYQPESNYHGTDVVTYTITDPSGLTSTAVVNITVNSVDDPILVPQSLELPAFNEANLPMGSGNVKEPLSFDGSFTLQALAGLASIGVGDRQLSLDSLRTLLSQPVESMTFTTPRGNTLQLTDFDEATGTVSYRFTLVNHVAHQGVNGERLLDALQLMVTDVEGDTANVLLNIPIVDDVPHAENDLAGPVVEDAELVGISGNVLVNDLHPNGQPGADGRTFDGWTTQPGVLSQYGTLVLGADGSYSFVLDSTLPTTEALKEGETRSESFSYNIVDDDGDPATASLTITIQGSNDVPRLNVEPGNEGGNDQVFEAGLPQGSAAGDGSTLAYGSFSLGDADGLDDLQSVTLNGTAFAMADLVGAVVVGAHGSLTVTGYDSTTGVASYQYELTSPTTDGAGAESEVFTLSVSDGSASSSPATITVDIIDDVPQAVADSNSVSEDGEVLTISGGVLANDLHDNGQPGADVPVSFIEWVAPQAQYGSFTDLGNGQYQYTLDNSLAAVQGLDEGQTLTEQFSYRMQDADGDPSTATLTITINGSNDVPRLNVEPGNEGGNDQVFEAGLPQGSAAGDGSTLAYGSFSLGDADGLDDLQSVTLNGTAFAMADLVGAVVVGAHGSLTVTGYDSTTGVASYQYELTSPTTDGAGAESEVFTLSVSDGSASSSPATITVDIIDDVPQAVADSNRVSEDGEVLTISGGVLANDLHDNGEPGADVPVSFIEWVAPQAQYGSFTDLGNGQYQYTLDNSLAAVQGLDEGQTLTEQFSYRMQDADGDPSTATLTITINGSNDIPTIKAYGEGLGVSESGLPEGSGVATDAHATGTFSIGDSDGLDDIKSLTIAGTTLTVAAGDTVADLVGRVVDTQYGQLTLDSFDAATGTFGYGYQLLHNVDNDSQPGADTNGFTETISLSVSDGTSSADTSFGVYIADDAPTATDNENSLDEDTVSVSGNVLTDDVDDVLGADGAAVSPLDIQDTYGHLTMDAAGVYTYTLDTDNATVQGLDDGQSLEREFTYTLTDKDGDVSRASLTITINGADDALDAVDDSDSFGEDAVQATVSGSVNVLSNDTEPDTTDKPLQVSDTGAQSLYLLNADGTLSSTVVGSITFAAGGSYSFTLDPAYKAQANALDSDETLKVGVEYTAINQDGATDTAVLRLTINGADDALDAVDDSDSFGEDAVQATVSGSVNVLSNDTEPDTTDKPLQVSDTGAQSLYLLNSDGTLSSTVVGSITFAAGGSYSFTLDPAYKAQANALDSDETLKVGVEYTAINQDGATDTAVLRLTINGADDALDAVDDSDSFGEDAVQATVSGSVNVLSNDTEPDTTDKPLQVSDTGAQSLYLLNSDGTLSSTVVGSITFAAGGSYSFTLDPAYKAQANALDSDETLKVGVEYTAINQDGATDTAVLRLTINGADDALDAVDDSDSFGEDAVQATVSGSVNVLSNDTEPDTTDKPLQVSDTGAQSLYLLNADGTLSSTVVGSITFAAGGSYSFTLDPAYKAQANALDSDETLKVGVEYTAINQDGATDTAVLRLTINGADDALDAVDDSDSFGEDAVQATVSGSVNVLSNDTEPDTTDKPLQVSDTGAQSLYLLNSDGTLSSTVVGSITFAAGGSYSFTLDPAYKAQANALDSDETLKVGVEYTAINQDGATDTAVLRLTINGADDALDAVDDSDSFGEDAVQATVSGSVNVLSNDTEPDTTDKPLQVSDTGAQSLYLLNSDGTLSSTVVGSITFAAGGSYSFTLDPAYKAQANALDSDETLKVGVEYTAINQDGATDTAVLRLTINGSNDAPEITISSSGLTVYEAGLPSGTNAASNSESASGQFTVGDTDGLDDIKSITIGATTLSVGAGGLAALVNSTVDTGYGSLRLTEYRNGTFDYKYTLTDPVDNDSVSGADTNGFTEVIGLSVSDGSSSASGSIPVTIIDDNPVNIQPMSAVVANSGKALGSGALDLFGHIGADKLGSVVFEGVDGTVLTGLFEGATKNITSGGENIILTGFGTNTLVGTTPSTPTTSGLVVMTITLNPDANVQSADRYTIEFQQSLDDGSKLAFDNFSTAPAGQNYWIGLDSDGNAIGADANDSTDLLITAAGVAAKVNTSSSDLGADNQHIDGGEGVRLDLVIDVDRAPGKYEKDSGGFVYDQHYSTHDFTFKLIQVIQAPCVVQLAAYNFDDLANKTDLAAGSTAVGIVASSIEVKDAYGDPLTLGTDYQVFEDASGKVFLTNMNAGYEVSFAGKDMFEAVVITNADGMTNPATHDTFVGGSFDIGGFSYDASEAGSNIDLSFALQVTDADGDTSSGQLDMTVVPNGNVLLGDGDANLLVGDTRDERLEGANGADTLLGGEGDDTLLGGQGNDILVGGDNNDLFVWKSGDADGSTDRVSDFQLGVDQLDFADVLDGGVSAGNLANYLQVTPDDSDTVINVFSNGVVGSVPDLIVVLEGCSADIQQLDDLLTNNGVIY